MYRRDHRLQRQADTIEQLEDDNADLHKRLCAADERIAILSEQLKDADADTAEARARVAELEAELLIWKKGRAA